MPSLCLVGLAARAEASRASPVSCGRNAGKRRLRQPRFPAAMVGEWTAAGANAVRASPVSFGSSLGGRRLPCVGNASQVKLFPPAGCRLFGSPPSPRTGQLPGARQQERRAGRVLSVLPGGR